MEMTDEEINEPYVVNVGKATAKLREMPEKDRHELIKTVLYHCVELTEQYCENMRKTFDQFQDIMIMADVSATVVLNVHTQTPIMMLLGSSESISNGLDSILAKLVDK